MKGKMMKKLTSVATVLERELEPTIKEWLRQVNRLPELTHVPLNDEDRRIHLPKLFHDIARRLRLPNGASLPNSTDATEHGQRRREQGYTPAMLVEESRLFEVVTFQTLQRYQGELDQDQLLLDVTVIADEVDLQLTQAVRCFEPRLAQLAA
jgi:hypothetical protein